MHNFYSLKQLNIKKEGNFGLKYVDLGGIILLLFTVFKNSSFFIELVIIYKESLFLFDNSSSSARE